MRQLSVSRLAWRAVQRGFAAQAEAVQATNGAFSAAAGAAQNSKDGKVLHPDLLNENMRKTQYAVRGELYLKAEELKNKGKPIIFTNGGRGARGGAPLRCAGGPTRPTIAAPAPARAPTAVPPSHMRSGQPAQPGCQAHHLHAPGARRMGAWGKGRACGARPDFLPRRCAALPALPCPSYKPYTLAPAHACAVHT